MPSVPEFRVPVDDTVPDLERSRLSESGKGEEQASQTPNTPRLLRDSIAKKESAARLQDTHPEKDSPNLRR